MKENPISNALQEKNEQDFADVTKRIQDALLVLTNNHRLKPTQGVLAKLAKCSRGTLNNRSWPIEQLQLIKSQRKVEKSTNSVVSNNVEKVESRIERYKSQLYDSREELLLWKSKFDEASEQLRAQQHINTILQKRLDVLEDELKPSKQKSRSKVVELAPRHKK